MHFQEKLFLGKNQKLQIQVHLLGSFGYEIKILDYN